MGMLDTSTGLLKALPEKILLSSRGSGMSMASSRSANMISFPMMSSSVPTRGDMVLVLGRMIASIIRPPCHVEW